MCGVSLASTFGLAFPRATTFKWGRPGSRSRMRRAALALLLVSLLTAGCLNAVTSKLQPGGAAAPVASLADLASKNAKSAVDGADGTRTFEWDGKGPGG